MARLTDAERLVAYEAAIHELVNAVAQVKTLAQLALDDWERDTAARNSVKEIIAVAEGKLATARERMDGR